LSFFSSFHDITVSDTGVGSSLEEFLKLDIYTLVVSSQQWGMFFYMSFILSLKQIGTRKVKTETQNTFPLCL
jgi:hypothetical protein